MRLSNGQILAFQRIYKARFGREISREEAGARGIELVQLVSRIYKPISHAGLLELQRSDADSDSNH